MRSILIPFFFLIFGCNEKPPADLHLLNVYQKNKATFKILRDMMCGDRYKYIYSSDKSDPENIPELKLRTYLRLLKEVEGVLISKSDKCNISISTWEFGRKISGGPSKSKGFIMNPDQWNAELVDSLDEQYKKRKSEAFFHRKIDNDWYLYYYDFQ
ncbi:MAG: hypothetical protein ABJI60_00070 [Kangiellaceae bacterium]